MDIETIVYIAIFILFSIFSGNKANKKKKRGGREESEHDSPDTSLEDEIRRMADRMMGKKEEEKPQPTEYKREEYKPLSERHKEEEKSPYETYNRNYDNERPLERIPSEPVVDYSENDIETLREYNKRIQAERYKTEVINYEAKSVESLAKGKELHTVMDDEEPEQKNVMEIIDERFDYSNFDPRKAVIFTEILKRPQY